MSRTFGDLISPFMRGPLFLGGAACGLRAMLVSCVRSNKYVRSFQTPNAPDCPARREYDDFEIVFQEQNDKIMDFAVKIGLLAVFVGQDLLINIQRCLFHTVFREILANPHACGASIGHIFGDRHIQH